MESDEDLEVFLSNSDLKKVVEFHGHVCPGLAYGYRAALAALEAIGPRARDEELVAIVENDSCAVDAIQVMTGCTFGKGNLIFRDTGKSVYTFLSRSTGKGVRISVDFKGEETPEEATARKKYFSDVVASVSRSKSKKVRSILNAPEDKVLKKTPTSETLPAKATIYSSVHCSSCGEKVMEPRIRLRDGKLVCIPCSS